MMDGGRLVEKCEKRLLIAGRARTFSQASFRVLETDNKFHLLADN
jgi:hypothetical protein